jgi:hypothetical protein
MKEYVRMDSENELRTTERIKVNQVAGAVLNQVQAGVTEK